MEITLSVIALGTAVLAAVLSFLVPLLAAPSPRPEQRPRLSLGLWLGLALVLVLFLAALPKEPPFSPGQRLGWGFLIGGLAALVGALCAAYLPNPGRAYWPYPPMVVLSLAVAAASLSYALFRGDPADALLGSALGAAVVAGLFRLLYRDHDAPHVLPALEAGAGASATVAAACCLAVHHFANPSQRGWWAFPLALAGFWLLGQVVAYFATTHRALAKHPLALLALSGAAAALLAISLGDLLAVKLEPAQSVALLLVSGIITAAIILWLTLSAERALAAPLLLSLTGLSALLVIFLVMLSYKLLAGFGVGVALLGAWSVAAAALGLGSLASLLPMRLLLIGANVLLLRVFLERAGAGLGEPTMSFHYTLMGVVVGAVLPPLYSGLALRPGLGRALLLGALASASPIVMLTFWGQDALLGMLVGLVAGQAISAGLAALGEALPAGPAAETYAVWQAPTGLLGLGMGLVAAQFSRACAFLYQMPRAEKAYIAYGIGALVVLWAVALGLVQLRRQSLAARAEAAGGRQEG